MKTLVFCLVFSAAALGQQAKPPSGQPLTILKRGVWTQAPTPLLTITAPPTESVNIICATWKPPKDCKLQDGKTLDQLVTAIMAASTSSSDAQMMLSQQTDSLLTEIQILQMELADAKGKKKEGK